MTDLIQLGKQAQASGHTLSLLATEEKNRLLLAMAAALEKETANILVENNLDLAQASANGISETMQDRLRLTPERISEMADGMRQVAALPDPIGEVDKMWKNADGLLIGKQRVPLGVIGIIYESRPNVTTDAASLCFKTGNAVILRGGKEAFHSNKCLVNILQNTLQSQGFSPYAIQFVDDTSRETAAALMKLNDYLDVLIPRGGAGLIRQVKATATVPVIETGTGNNHIYIDEAADLAMAVKIVINAKVQRPSVCNAIETILVHEKVAAEFLPLLEKELQTGIPVELRGDNVALQYLQNAELATEADWQTEFLDYILAIKVVDSVDAAIAHINHYNTKHSEAIITESYSTSQKFLAQVDAAAVYVNASTRFTDGFIFGFGAEIGISTQKLHARGPMGLQELTSIKYIIYGNGQIRE
ncbi:glutamate-5-semialdehyde dehydrogenase [Enterococcus sp. PF1-24]|uniref:glutamate-5-semialdehyde dehydrogenase n=1 Tax=unclassified Enterococcus TaxID=2608891 RepID=UPI002476E213|nr:MULTISPECIES: glutamate-5-semialdehyde dehydrogenase [unclassified Enterococcus]MDH6364855.1 glutamate-5-semialdehyde dehydrogenase [Enterococcus sp. PFB1-1]MDH6401921.1 glutamate-5-semialdehyde dehydrogenase [Enterococcus sp. PF1-24]